MDIVLERGAVEAMKAAAAEAVEREACGLLLGGAGDLLSATIEANVAADMARAFEIDPKALFVAQRLARAGGRTLAGWWHSHPNGSTEPSACDAARARADNMIWIIVARGEVRGWRAVRGGSLRGRFAPVTLRAA